MNIVDIVPKNVHANKPTQARHIKKVLAIVNLSALLVFIIFWSGQFFFLYYISRPGLCF